MSKALFCGLAGAILLAGNAHAADEMVREGKNQLTRQDFIERKMDDRWREMDSNHDDTISKREFMDKAEERFKEMDFDANGKITREERDAYRKKRFEEAMQKKGMEKPEE